jgi:dedicator of cytokinesis protein 9/10/11
MLAGGDCSSNNINNNNNSSSNNGILLSSYLTCVTHHNKQPQFYDEIKLLLPLNLTEKHHILFKFYHVSCSNAKSNHASSSPQQVSEPTSNSSSVCNSSNHINGELVSIHSLATSASQATTIKSVETLIGYAWLPIFKSGRIICGEKHLPVAQNLPNQYLSFEQIGLGQIIGPSDIRWVENMKPLFRVSLVANTAVHTTVNRILFFG